MKDPRLETLARQLIRYSCALKPGERVLIEGETGQVLGLAVLVYVLPIVLFFVGYVLGSLLFEGKDAIEMGYLAELSLIPTLVGMVVAAVSGYLAIRFMLQLIQKISLNWFALYVAIVGVVVLVLQLAGVPGGTVDGKEVEMLVKVGDKVLTSKYSGTEVKVDGEECTIVRQSDILAIVEE